MLLNKKISLTKLINFFVIIFFLIALFMMLSFNSHQLHDIQNIDSHINSNPCTYGTYEVSKNLNDFEIQVIPYSISFLPEVENFKCYSKVIKIELIQNKAFIYSVTSTSLVNYSQIFLITFFFMIYKKEDKTISMYAFLFMFIFAILIIYNFLFFNFSNYLFILTKGIFLFLSFYFLKNSNFQNTYIFNFFIFLNVFIFSGLYYSRFISNEIYYFEKWKTIDPNLSVNFSNENSFFAYQELISIFNNFFNDQSKLVLTIILIFWLTWIIKNFIEILNFPKFIGLVGMTIIYYNYELIGGEYFFGQIMPKVFSFLAIFSSLIFIIQNKKSKFIFFIVLSLYTHFAVAILSAPLVIYIYLKYLGFKKIFVNSFLIFILSIPLIGNVYSDVLIKRNNDTLDNIRFYITELFPHHIYPFDELTQFEEFKNVFIYEFINVLIIFFIAYIIKSKDLIANKLLGNVLNFTFFICVILTLINYFFPFSYVVLLYPFKFYIFLILTAFFIFLDLIIQKKYHEKVIILFFIIWFFNFFQITNLDKKINFDNFYALRNNVSIDLANYVIEENPKLIITSENLDKNIYFSDLEYQTRIPNYVNLYFPPMNIYEITDWRIRISKVNKFYSGDCKVFENFETFIYVDIKPDNNCGKLIHSIENIYLCNTYCNDEYVQKKYLYFFKFEY
ncbi:MAG: hypothetical protein CBE33_05405 [Candidatus Pelagibacter sp. TMED273]|nr:MAG: hypothetical protein CBE33_05405 [Candidatus Pelagibacter sp. TMED273]|tara:strand:+ start:6918 stop:8939 length:2022 start_codon:yes stop_codon:yes gene_type:complete